jgi:hypothetical protein
VQDDQQDERHGRSSCVIRTQRLAAEPGIAGVVVVVVVVLDESDDGVVVELVEPLVEPGAVVVPLPLIVPLPLTVPPGVVVVVRSVVELLLVLVPGLPVVSSRRSQADNRPIATRTASEAVESVFMEKLLDTG